MDIKEMEKILSKALCRVNAAEDPECIGYWLGQIADLFRDIGEEGRAEIVRRMFEMKGFDMTETPKPNVGEFYLIAMQAARRRITGRAETLRNPEHPCQ